MLIAARDGVPDLDVAQLAGQALDEITALVPATINPARRVRWLR